jgi:hypothetical protein
LFGLARRGDPAVDDMSIRSQSLKDNKSAVFGLDKQRMSKPKKKKPESWIRQVFEPLDVGQTAADSSFEATIIAREDETSDRVPSDVKLNSTISTAVLPASTSLDLDLELCVTGYDQWKWIGDKLKSLAVQTNVIDHVQLTFRRAIHQEPTWKRAKNIVNRFIDLRKIFVRLSKVKASSVSSKSEKS